MEDSQRRPGRADHAIGIPSRDGWLPLSISPAHLHRSEQACSTFNPPKRAFRPIELSFAARSGGVQWASWPRASSGSRYDGVRGGEGLRCCRFEGVVCISGCS